MNASHILMVDITLLTPVSCSFRATTRGTPLFIMDSKYRSLSHIMSS